MENEKRLIDASAMREDWLENGENEYVYDTNAVLDSIDAQPTVDAVEVVHGRWLAIHDGWGCCSNCRRMDEILEQATHCRFCGAKMDGDGNG